MKVKGKLITKAESRSSTAHPEEQTIIKEGQLDTIPFMKQEDFMLKREYKIVKSVSTVFGKWPQTYGNAFFTDSKWLLTDFYEMLQSNLGVYMERNEFVEDERVFA